MTNSPEAPTARCKTCVHWIPIPPHAAIHADVGECRARPPIQNYTWPRTKGDQRCGDYKNQAPRPPARREGSKRISTPPSESGTLLNNDTLS